MTEYEKIHGRMAKGEGHFFGYLYYSEVYGMVCAGERGVGGDLETGKQRLLERIQREHPDAKDIMIIPQQEGRPFAIMDERTGYGVELPILMRNFGYMKKNEAETD